MLPDLTPRERRTLILKANGYTDPQAADKQGLSVRTVTKTLERIYRKFGVHGATQAVAIAIAIGEIGIHEIIIPGKQQEAA